MSSGDTSDVGGVQNSSQGEGPARRGRDAFGSLLHDLRKRRGMTLTKLASLCSLDAGNLSRIERGERSAPGAATLKLIMEALRIFDDPEKRTIFVLAAARSNMSFGGRRDEAFEVVGREERWAHPRDRAVRRAWTLTETAVDVGIISATLGIRKVTVETSEGLFVEFPICETPGGYIRYRTNEK